MKQSAKEVTKRALKAMIYFIRVPGNDIATASDFCRVIGEHPQNIKKIERGERSFTLDQICTICEKLKVSPAWLILGKGDMLAAQPVKKLNSIDLLETAVAAIKSEYEGEKKKS